MITIPHRSSDCQIAISTDNSQVTKRCQGTKTTDGKIEWVRMRCWTLVFVSEYFYVSKHRIQWEYYVSYCQTAHHNHRGILKGFGSCHSYDNKRIKDKCQKRQNETQGTENVVVNVKYLVLNITWKVSNKARLVGMLTGVLRLHDSILKFEKKNVGLQFRAIR